MEHLDRPAVATYREFAPCAELDADVEAIFTFVPGAPAVDRRVLRQVVFRAGDSFCAPRIANGGASIALELGMTCPDDGPWSTTSRVGGFVIGPMSQVGPAVPGQCPLMVGVYLKPGRIATFTGIPAAALTDSVVPLEELWRSGSDLAHQLADLDEGERIAHLERELLRHRSARSDHGVRVAGLTTFIGEHRGRVSVERLSGEAGVSRQHLTRVFRDVVGLTPKLYCRLVRFHAGLVYAGRGTAFDGADVAQTLGYADQSHMIAEFRHFSSLTPSQLASRPWFHPFIERAKAHNTPLAGKVSERRYQA